MNILKNKHLIMAMFIAPVLAVIAYFAVDHVVSEKPHAAVQGSSYKLSAKSNCRYKSGVCTLKNGDVEVNLRVDIIADSHAEISLNTDVPVQSALVSFVGEGENTEPTAMKINAERADTWMANINTIPSDESILRLALNISDTLYYAETTTVFIDYETSFSRENFSN